MEQREKRSGKNICERQLMLPALEQNDGNSTERRNIIPFIRKKPQYAFPFRINREYEDSGDAA